MSKLDMRTEDESEIEHAVARRVASVTIESDSQGEADTQPRIKHNRPKKKGGRSMNSMEIDLSISSPTACNKRMDWEAICSTSELSSSETHSSDGREADDEQSDWVGPEPSQNLPCIQVPITKPHRLIGTRTASAVLQRKLERFIRDKSQRELVVKQWTRSRQISRILKYFGLEISKRTRGTVILKKTK